MSGKRVYLETMGCQMNMLDSHDMPRALWLLNHAGVYRAMPYGLLGIALWACVHAGGLHATLAGVVLAACCWCGCQAQPIYTNENGAAGPETWRFPVPVWPGRCQPPPSPK